MKISQVASIELDRTTPFRHEVLFKDVHGYVLDRVPVEESKGWEQFSLIYQKWASHPDFNPIAKEIE